MSLLTTGRSSMHSQFFAVAIIMALQYHFILAEPVITLVENTDYAVIVVEDEDSSMSSSFWTVGISDSFPSSILIKDEDDDVDMISIKDSRVIDGMLKHLSTNIVEIDGLSLDSLPSWNSSNSMVFTTAVNKKGANVILGLCVLNDMSSSLKIKLFGVIEFDAQLVDNNGTILSDIISSSNMGSIDFSLTSTQYDQLWAGNFSIMISLFDGTTQFYPIRIGQLPTTNKFRPRIYSRGGSLFMQAKDLHFSSIPNSNEISFPKTSIQTILDGLNSTIHRLPNTIQNAIEDYEQNRQLDQDRKCPDGQFLQGIDENGQLICYQRDANFDREQKRLTESCPENSAIRQINKDGSIECADSVYQPDFGSELQRRITGTCGGDTGFNRVTSSGTVDCKKSQRIGNIQNVLNQFDGPGAKIETLNSQLDSLVSFDAWESWTECSEPCNGGVRHRYRNLKVNGQVIGKVHDSETCNTGACPDYCNGNPRMYYVNSGRSNVKIVSLARDNFIYFNNNPQPLGALGIGDSVSLGATPKNGDFVCGSNGPVEVISTESRPWVSDRFKGKKFFIPNPRENPQAVYFHALENAVVTAYFPVNNKYSEKTLTKGQTEVFRYNGQNQAFRIESTGNIVVSYVGRGSGSSPKDFDGVTDYVPVPPAENTVYGVASGNGNIIGGREGSLSFQRECANGASGTGGSAPDTYFKFGGSGGGNAPACLFRATNTEGLLHSVSHADGDGTEATPYLGKQYMTKNFIVPYDTQHIIMTCAGPSTTLTFWKKKTDSLNDEYEKVSEKSFSNPQGFEVVSYTTAVAEEKAGGVLIRSDPAPCFMVVDPVPEGRERIFFGY